MLKLKLIILNLTLVLVSYCSSQTGNSSILPLTSKNIKWKCSFVISYDSLYKTRIIQIDTSGKPLSLPTFLGIRRIDTILNSKTCKRILKDYVLDRHENFLLILGSMLDNYNNYKVGLILLNDSNSKLNLYTYNFNTPKPNVIRDSVELSYKTQILRIFFDKSICSVYDYSRLEPIPSYAILKYENSFYGLCYFGIFPGAYSDLKDTKLSEALINQAEELKSIFDLLYGRN